MRKATLFALMIAVLVSGAASADVLWDQTDYDLWVPGFFNSDSGSPPFGLTHYAVSDITVDGAGWHVDSISIFFGAADPAWGDTIASGYLNVFPKTGPLPGESDDPTTGTVVPMSAVLDGDHFVVTASGLGLDLLPGDYWISITPVAPGGFFGPEPHLATMSLIGDATASYDPYAFPPPAMWFNFNPGVDSAILIEGFGFPCCDGGDDEGGDDEGMDGPTRVYTSEEGRDDAPHRSVQFGDR